MTMMERQKGFTLLEVVLVVGLLGLIMPVMVTIIRQLVVQSDRNITRITAVRPLEDTGRLLGREIPLAQEVSIESGGTVLRLYWTDWGDQGNYDTYSLSQVAYKRVRVTYAISGANLERTTATCANQDSENVLCTSQVVSGADWTDGPNTKWVDGEPVLNSDGSFNSASRASDPASPKAAARNLTSFLVSQSVSVFTVAVSSSPKGSAGPTEARTYTVYGNLLNSEAPL